MKISDATIAFLVVVAMIPPTSVLARRGRMKMCRTDDQCATGYLCNEMHRCEPVECIQVHDPVCGADGIEYPNHCEARAAHVDISHQGPCAENCGGIAGLTCSKKGDACIFEDGRCDWADDMGLCVAPPEACFDVYDPVCGCDGKTYGNRCEALSVGMSVDYAGQCNPCTIDELNIKGRCLQKCYGDQDCKTGSTCNAAEVCLQDPACPPCDVCVGWCESAPDCNDGTPLMCRMKMMEPLCPEGSISAVQNGCYVCVNPLTCLPPNPCTDTPECKYDRCPDPVLGECGQKCAMEGETCGNEIGDFRTCMNGQWACAIHPPMVPPCGGICSFPDLTY